MGRGGCTPSRSQVAGPGLRALIPKSRSAELHRFGNAESSTAAQQTQRRIAECESWQRAATAQHECLGVQIASPALRERTSHTDQRSLEECAPKPRDRLRRPPWKRRGRPAEFAFFFSRGERLD